MVNSVGQNYSVDVQDTTSTLALIKQEETEASIASNGTAFDGYFSAPSTGGGDTFTASGSSSGSTGGFSGGGSVGGC